jgi:alcohol dehydrogenase class IV
MSGAFLEFSAPTRIVCGLGAVEARLGEELRRLHVPVVAVVVDRGFADAGMLAPLLDGVHGVETPVAALIGEDPSVEEAERAARAAIAAGAGAVLAVGGGSALVAGKAVAVRLTNEGSLPNWQGRDRVPRRPAPCVAIPTTAGSGSEVSNAIVLHDPGFEQHLVVRGRGCEPDVALLDGEMLRTLPRRPMVLAALDALSHALEALWVRKATAFTDALALHAAAMIRESLVPALDRQAEAMQALIEASAVANLACGSSELGLVHALSSSALVTLPHGYQNGVLLPYVAAFNRDAASPRARPHLDALPALYEEIGFEPRFGRGEVDPVAARRMIRAALGNPFRLNNLRHADEADLRALLRGAGAQVP